MIAGIRLVLSLETMQMGDPCVYVVFGAPTHLVQPRNHIDAVRVLLEYRADPHQGDATGTTAVHYACSCGNAPRVPLGNRLRLRFFMSRSAHVPG